MYVPLKPVERFFFYYIKHVAKRELAKRLVLSSYNCSIQTFLRNKTIEINSRTTSSSDRMKYTHGIGSFQTKAPSSPRGTPNNHVPIKSMHMTYVVFPPLLMIPPPRIMFCTFTGAIMAKAINICRVSSRTCGST